jgi:tetratricopeptide (TPR) repeat protein
MADARRLTAIVLWCLMAASSARAGGEGEAAYLDGLDALEAGRYADAASAFTQAIQANDENHAYWQARGVARTLNEQFADALKDYQRAQKLKDDEETRLWMAANYSMSGDPMNGSKWFTHGRNLPRDYPNLVYNEMAATYWSSATHGEYFDRQTQQRVRSNGPVKTQFPQAAAAFVALHKTAAATGGPAAVTRMKDLMAKGNYTAAMREIRILRASKPDDEELLASYADCALRLGDVETARTVYTRLATTRWNQGSLYLNRALAAATLGDAARVEADLKTAQTLAPRETPGTAAEAKRRLAALPTASDPAGALATLQQAIQANAPWDQQVQLATALQRSVTRRRVDEQYQDRIRALEAALAAEPRSADRLADLALFLWDSSTVRGERVCFRAPMVAYRTTWADERPRARKLAENALKINPKHAKALVALAHLQLHAYQFADAESTIRQLAAIAPRDERLPMLYAQLLESVAAIKMAKASDLRQVRQWEDSMYIYTRWPSETELARAEQLQAEAQRLSREAAKAIDDAAARFAGQPLGFYYQAVAQRDRGQLREAVAALQQMVKLDPKSEVGWSQLAGSYEALNMPLEALEARATAVNLTQTTATPFLELAWTYIVQTRFRSARGLIERSVAIDPGNPRVFAYLGIVAVGQEKPAEAELAYRTALALDEARARLRGTTLVGGSGAIDDVEWVGLTCAVRRRLAGLLTAAGKDEGASVGQVAAGFASRFSRTQMTEPVHTALLPDEQPDATTLPESPRLAALVAWGHLASGDAQLKAGKLDEAQQQYQAAVTLETDWPATAPGRQQMMVTTGWARLGLLRIALARKDVQSATQLSMSGPPVRQMPADFTAQWEAARQQAQALREQGWQEPAMPQPRFNRNASERDRLLAQKQYLEQLMQSPELDPQSKQVLKEQIDQIDRRLNQPPSRNAR